MTDLKIWGSAPLPSLFIAVPWKHLSDLVVLFAYALNTYPSWPHAGCLWYWACSQKRLQVLQHSSPIETKTVEREEIPFVFVGGCSVHSAFVSWQAHFPFVIIKPFLPWQSLAHVAPTLSFEDITLEGGTRARSEDLCVKIQRLNLWETKSECRELETTVSTVSEHISHLRE